MKIILGSISIIGFIFLTSASVSANTNNDSLKQSTNQAKNDSLTNSDTARVVKEALTDDDMEKILQRQHEKNVSAYRNIDEKYWESMYGSGDTVLLQKLAGQYGLFLQFGFLKANSLYKEENSQAQSRPGFSFVIGFYHFISENVEFGANFTYNYFPQWCYLCGSATTWSLLEMGGYLKYIQPLSSKTGLYGKFGFKSASLKSSRRPGRCLLGGGECGSYQKTGTDYVPGVELAIGLIIKRLKNKAVFIEAGYSCLYMNGRDVEVKGEPAKWSYPSDLKSGFIRIGGFIPLGRLH